MSHDLANALRAIAWPVQGQSRAPDNLFDWLHASNRYPQHRGRAAALALITSQAAEIEGLRRALEPFAKAADRYEEAPKGFVPMGDNWTCAVRLGHLRAARTALQHEGGGREG